MQHQNRAPTRTRRQRSSPPDYPSPSFASTSALTSLQIDEVSRVLAEVDITDVSTDHIREALDNEYAAGDIAKAVDFIQMATRASQGKILPYDPKTQMTGAVNREFVTCYLDALLFAMFARMDAYEPMLQHEFTDEPRKKLATLLRLWVNMLRAGKLIHTDMVRIPSTPLPEGWLITADRPFRPKPSRRPSQSAAGQMLKSWSNKTPRKRLPSSRKPSTCRYSSCRSTSSTRERETRTTTRSSRNVSST
jgi:hypothetical protein